MLARLPGKRATLFDTPFCTVTIALGDLMDEVFSLNKLIVVGFCLLLFTYGAGHASASE